MMQIASFMHFKINYTVKKKKHNKSYYTNVRLRKTVISLA